MSHAHAVLDSRYESRMSQIMQPSICSGLASRCDKMSQHTNFNCCVKHTHAGYYARVSGIRQSCKRYAELTEAARCMYLPRDMLRRHVHTDPCSCAQNYIPAAEKHASRLQACKAHGKIEQASAHAGLPNFCRSSK